MSKTILVTGPDLAPAAQELVQTHGFETVHTPAYAASEVIADFLVKTDAVAVVSRMGRIDANVIASAPSLKVISKHGVGVDNIDLAAAAQKGIPVLKATGANAISVAEHAITLMLTTVKRILPLDSGLRAGKWEKPGFKGVELAGSTLALMGLGAIAQETGKIAKGLGLKLVGYDPFASQDCFDELGVERVDSLTALLAQADILSLHCPLNDQTRQMINEESIRLMPEGSYIVNTARGGLIDEDALLAAVQSGHLAGAGLDTFATEPPAADHPFWQEPRIVSTPHIGGVTHQANARVGCEAVRGIFQILDGEAVAKDRYANWALLVEAGHR
ncbi:D-3-phosphoglycerate dehydrogenase [Cohaesibacter marisflavi]|uniref:D-3-phosphoglycerate dehydrogenase n=1 Tax=Cohaesibacter marisflavi TaxID=655353 RepID=A0A1I5CJV7_9HYPH|nr:hydroxyacid dehydrogenase [Cohaesibacter marisflavi]SFN87278.1 D-3-phosphoglycerate dehydrogenase [Cohaesibacter marisflavi]